MDLQFEGDLSTFSDAQLNLVRDVYQEQGFNNCKVYIESVGEKGDNYIANVIRIRAIKDGKTFQVIAKVAPKAEMLRQMTQAVVAFKNEIIMYTKVLPKFVELQRNAGCTEKEIFRYPICYGVLTEAPEELLILEDLKPNGFEIKDRLKSLTEEQIRCALNNLATFHSLTFALKSLNPEVFEEAKNELKNMWAVFNSDEQLQHAFAMAEESILEMLETDEQKRHAKGVISTTHLMENHIEKAETNSKYVTIVQGDCWSSNLMFSDTHPLECIMIDYQVSRIASPAADLLYFFFHCTDREIRKKHYYEWIEYYHKMFDNSLSNFNLKANFVYPREKLDTDLKFYGKFSYGLSAFISTFILREKTDVIDLNALDSQEKVEEFQPMDGIKGAALEKLATRISELTECCIDYGYI